MTKKGGKSNHTTRPIPSGANQPKNNQGVKPNPKGGSTGGSK